MNSRFTSRVDGFDFPGATALGAGWEIQWRALLQRAAPEALNRLRPSFGGALEYHDVPGWMTRVQVSDAALGAAAVLAALDYFVWPAATRKQSQELDAHLRKRHLDFWRENGPSLLTWLAVLRNVPEEWVPRAVLEHRIQRQLQSSGVATAVEVRIDLHLPVPGGRRWLLEQSHGQLDNLRTNIAARGLCPIVAFTDRGMEVLLVVECDPELLCYDPARPGTERSIDPAALEGLFCIRHTPEMPPLSVWQRAAGSMGLKRVAWDLTRAWRRRFRRAAV